MASAVIFETASDKDFPGSGMERSVRLEAAVVILRAAADQGVRGIFFHPRFIAKGYLQPPVIFSVTLLAVRPVRSRLARGEGHYSSNTKRK
jgi:hypothetical protein